MLAADVTRQDARRTVEDNGQCSSGAHQAAQASATALPRLEGGAGLRRVRFAVLRAAQTSVRSSAMLPDTATGLSLLHRQTLQFRFAQRLKTVLSAA